MLVFLDEGYQYRFGFLEAVVVLCVFVGKGMLTEVIGYTGTGYT